MGLKYESAAFISTSKLLEPVFASVMGIFMLSEMPSLYSVIGGIIIIVGVITYCNLSEA